MKKDETWPLPYTIHRHEFEIDYSPKYKSWNCIISRRKHRKYLLNLEIDKDFFRPQKAVIIKEKTLIN